MKPSLYQDTEALFGNQLFEHAPIGLAVTSGYAVFVRVNPAFCRFLGYSKQELLGKTVRDVTYPDDWETSAELIRRLRSPRKPTKPFEKRYRHKSGKVVWGEVSLFVIGNGSHKEHCAMAQVVDITERKEAEEELRLSNERFRVALAGSPTTVFIQDRTFRYTWAYNPVSPVKLEDFLGKTDSEIFNPHEAKTLMRIKRKVMKTGVGHRVEVVLHSFDDEKVFDARYEPLRDDQGKIIGLICAAIDITKHKYIEDKLRESKERLEAVFKTSPVGIYISRKAGGEIIEANDALQKIIGYSTEETIGQTSKTLRLWVNPKKRNQTVALLRQQGQINEVEFQLRRRSGEIATALLTAVPLKIGAGTYFLGALMDITKRKQLESALQEAKDSLEQKVKERTVRLRQLTEELTRAEHQERRRIADILHEHLQQQLCGMKFRAAHLKAGSAEPSTIDFANKLINDLDQTIHLTRTLSSNLYPQVLSFPEVKGFIEWLAVDTMNSLGLDVKTKVDARLTLASLELRMFIFDAIRELLLNVSKHSKVKTANVRVSLMANGLIQIQVKDTGVGCDPKQNLGANRHIGLFRIQERAESLGGRLEVVSQPGKGTCATLVVPRS